MMAWMPNSGPLVSTRDSDGPGDVDGAGDDQQHLRRPERVAEADAPLGLDAALGDEVVDDLEHGPHVVGFGADGAAAGHARQQRLGVGEPAGPAPPVGLVARGEHHDGEVAGRVEHRGLHDEPAQQRVARGVGAGDAEDADPADVEVDRDGGIGRRARPRTASTWASRCSSGNSV